MAVEIVFETHSTSQDNERGRSTGWLPGRLSTTGREQAAALGARRREDGITAVFASDLARAIETAEIAMAGTHLPLFVDWRLRECNYGAMNGSSAARMHRDRRLYVDRPYPGGESWRAAVGRVERFLGDLRDLWPGQRVLVIGHVATRWALDHWIRGVPLEQLAEEAFQWQPGWEYQLP
jgi:2,3-bisphosphoglycerate-dependent phosphoglycerate mutase